MISYVSYSWSDGIFFLCFFDSLMMLDRVVQGLYTYDIQIKTNKFCIARMYSSICGVFILKNLHKQKSEKLLQNLVEIPFSFLHVIKLK
jgi:hypothetical protein